MQNEKQYLQNAADQIGLTIHEYFNQDKRKTVKMYFAAKNNISISPVLNYDQLNNFLFGWIRCIKTRETLRNKINYVRDEILNTIDKKRIAALESIENDLAEEMLKMMDL